MFISDISKLFHNFFSKTLDCWVIAVGIEIKKGEGRGTHLSLVNQALGTKTEAPWPYGHEWHRKIPRFSWTLCQNSTDVVSRRA